MGTWRGTAAEAFDELTRRGFHPQHSGDVVIWATGQERPPIPMRHVAQHGDNKPPWIIEIDFSPSGE
jgi:hypothetical protein